MPISTKVLILEDQKETQNLIEKFLSTENCTVKIAETVDEALKVLDNFRPHIAVVDQHLPKKSGLEFCNAVKGSTDDTINSIHILGITGDHKSQAETKMLNHGADDFIEKPFTKEDFIAKINVGKRIATKIRERTKAFEEMFEEIDTLIVQDGGCAPGYNPVTAYLTNHLEKSGRKVYCALEGYKSIVSGTNNDYVRLIYDPIDFKRNEHIKNVFNVSLLSDTSGAQFRSERFPEFKETKYQEQAAKNLMDKKVKAIIAIGGNGTLYGIKDLAKHLPKDVSLFFIPVTIDSDVSGTDTIGQHTGVELGAEKIKGYLADSRTHKRIYIIEMMGARGGFHALHSCIGARGHFAALPGLKVDFEKVATSLNEKTSSVIIVAEGFMEEEREAEKFEGSAADYFHKKLRDTGIDIQRKIVCEPFSRDIRGATPNNLDITLAQRMAFNTAYHLNEGNTKLMPAILGSEESVIPFSEIKTHNEVNSSLLKIANRLYT